MVRQKKRGGLFFKTECGFTKRGKAGETSLALPHAFVFWVFLGKENKSISPPRKKTLSRKRKQKNKLSYKT